MRKKTFILVFSLLLGITILFAGCGNKQTSKETNADSNEVKANTEVKSSSEPKANSETKSNNETKPANTKESIKAVLEKDKKISEITWNKDNSEVAFVKEIGDMEKQMYVFKVGDENEKKVEGALGNLYEFNWSPDNSYVTVNEGTSNVYETIIVYLKDLRITDKIVNTGGPVWSPDSGKLAFGVVNDKKPSVDMELNGTLDLMIYDIKSMTKTVVLKADNDFNYTPKSWDKNGLKYEKSYFDGRKSEEMTYDENAKVNTNSGYDISTETYSEKIKKLEIEIKYPVFKNIADKGVENKLNTLIKGKVDDYKQLYYKDEEEFKQTINADYEIMGKPKDKISIRFFISLYMEGAAHPNNLFDGVTFDLKTGMTLNFKDLFKPGVDYKKVLDPILKDKVKKLEFPLLSEYKGIDEEQEFYLKDNSLVVYYQVGVYTPHAPGPLMLEVSFDEIKDILK